MGCRERADKHLLVRLVWDTDRVVVDAAAVRLGRGGYLHDTERCWQLAVRRRAVGRALRLTAAQTATARVDELASSRAGSSDRTGELAHRAPCA